MYRLSFGILLCLVAVVTFVGCPGGDMGGDRPDRVPASATVTYNGAPIERAQVALLPQDPNGFGASGYTDAQGYVALSTFEPADGAVPGNYAVTVRKTEVKMPEGYKPPVTEEPDEGEEDLGDTQEYEEGEEPPEAITTDLLPTKYADEKTSGFSATVTEEGPNEFTFSLTDD